MISLELIRRGWFRSKYDVKCEGVLIGTIDNWRWQDTRTLGFGGADYQASISGWLRNVFILKCGDVEIAHAKKTRFLFRAIDIDFQGRPYVLKAPSWTSRDFFLMASERIAGSIVPQGLTGWTTKVTFEDDVPKGLQLFVIWLVVVQWDRGAASA